MGLLNKAIYIVIFIFVVYFSSINVLHLIAKLIYNFGRKTGGMVASKEIKITRYLYLHQGSLFAKIYNWINSQLIALNLRKLGITPLGYFMFCMYIAITISVSLLFWLHISFVTSNFVFVLVLVSILVLTRVVVSARIEKREMEVMDAIDLLIPTIGSGIQNSVKLYIGNMPNGIKSEFQTFLNNIDGKVKLEDAMIILADSLGPVFRDFSNKAIYFERQGDADAISSFETIIESNKKRRLIRESNKDEFRKLYFAFITVSVMCIVYGLFILQTNAHTRDLLLGTTIGNIVLLIMIGIIIGVLSFLTNIKSTNL